MRPVSFQELWNIVSSAKKVLISLHLGPDGDSIGSCQALKYVLERECKAEVTLISKDPLDAVLGASAFASSIVFGKSIAEIDLKQYDLIILPDSGVLKQFAPADFLLPADVPCVVIDHHASNKGFGTFFYLDTSKISTCSLLLTFFREVGVLIDASLATHLLLGVCTDSGFFAYDSGDSIKDAAFLIERGAAYRERISDPLRFSTPLRIKKYYARATEHFKTVVQNGLTIGYSSISQNDIKDLGLSLAEARGAVNYLQEIEGVDILFTLTELEDKIKGSFRSRRTIDISKYAEALGGGGHKTAAAFILPKIPLEEAERRVLDAIARVGVHRI